MGQQQIVPQHQINDVILSSQMADLGSDGYGGTAAGQSHFIAPFASRLAWFSVTADHVSGFDAATSFKAVNLANSNESADEQTYNTTAQGYGATVQLAPEDALGAIDALSMISIRSDGAPGTNRDGHVQACFRPTGPIDFPSNLFVYSGRIDDGAVGYDINWPVPFNIEVLEIQVGHALVTTGNTVLQVFKNGSSSIGTATAALGAAGTTGSSGRITDADRFLGNGDHLRVDMNATATAAGDTPYNVICRRI